MRLSTIIGIAACVLAGSIVRAQALAGPYELTKTIPIGGSGGWDYVTVDPDHKLVYVTHSTQVHVVDAAGGNIVAKIDGQAGNHGVVLVPASGRGFISDGKDGSIVIFDLKSNQVLGKIKAQADADGMVYDEPSGKVFVVSGDGGVVIPISPDLDPKSGSAGDPIDLGGKPEFLVSDGKGKLYINLMDKDQVAVVDTRTLKVTDHWPVAPGGQPVGMAMDRANRRLFIGCRKPQKMIVMSADDGKVLADLPIGAGVDATQFDDGYALASCRDATLAVVRETSPGKFEVVQTVATKPGARTMGLDPKTHTLYLPTAEMQPASGGGRPSPKPDSFMLLVVQRH